MTTDYRQIPRQHRVAQGYQKIEALRASYVAQCGYLDWAKRACVPTWKDA